MLGYLSADIICSEKQTVIYEEQIMSKDKYPSIFSPQLEAIVFIILQIFFAIRTIFKIGEYSRIFPSFQSRDALRPIASEKIWWIIMTVIYSKASPFLCLKDFKNSVFIWKSGPRFNLVLLKARKMLALNRFRHQYSVDVNWGSIKVWSFIFHGSLMQRNISLGISSAPGWINSERNYFL